MTSKQRAYLRGLANDLETILIVGKDGVTDNVIVQADGALETRELVKMRVLDTAFVSVREAAEAIASRTRSEVVFTIGTRAVLYRPAKKPKIVLPR